MRVEFRRGLSPRPLVHKYNPLTHRCTSETCLSLSEVLWWVRLLVYPFCDCSGHTVEPLWFSRMSVEPIYQELFVKHGDEFRGTLLASRGIRFQPGFTSWAGQTERERGKEGERSSVLARIRIQSLLALCLPRSIFIPPARLRFTVVQT